MPYHINKSCSLVLLTVELTDCLEHQCGIELAIVEWLIERLYKENHKVLKGVKLFPIPVLFPGDTAPTPVIGYLYSKKLPNIYKGDIFLHQRVDHYLRDKSEEFLRKRSAQEFIRFYARNGTNWDDRWRALV